MKKNVAGQIVGAQMVSATDGSAFTGSVTVAVTGDGGTQATGSVGAGACTHWGNGFHTYAPAQAETNYDHAAFTFTGTGAVPVTVQIYTSFPQTGDSYARLGAPAGASVSADIATIDTEVGQILTDTAEIGAAGAGLTAVPWNASWDAEVQSEVNDALVANGLDHLVGTAVADTDVADNSIIARLVDANATADFTNYNQTTSSLTALRFENGANKTAIPWNSAWDAEVQSEVNDALVAVGLDHLLAAAVTGTDVTDDSVIAKLVSASATADWDSYANTTDSLEAIRNRGDAAWTTGAGGTPPDLLVSTTIATLASQTSFTLTSGSADDDAYNGALAVVTDSATSTQKAVGQVNDYTGSTRTVTLSADPGIFTMAAGDSIAIVAVGQATASVDTAAIADAVWDEALSGHVTAGTAGKAIADIETDAAAILADTGTDGVVANVSFINGSSTAASTARDFFTTGAQLPSSTVSIGLVSQAALVDAVWDEALSGHTTAGSAGKAVADIETDATAILADTGTDGVVLAAGQTVASVSGAVGSVTGNVGGIAGTITTLDALDTAQDSQHATTQSAVAALNDPTAAAIADAVLDEALSGHVTAGTLGKAVADIETDVTAILADTSTDGVVVASGQTIDANAVQISGSATAADQLEAHALTVVAVTFTGGTTTTAVLGNVGGSAASSTNDVYNSRLLVFNAGTLNRQVTQITDYDGATKTATITAVTTAVTSGHTAILI